MRGTLLAAVVLAFVPCAMTAAEVQTGAGRVVVEPMATGLVEPWSLAFLPEGGFLVTERDGRLTRVDPAGERHAVAGVPVVFARGQGGLFDVLLPRDFPDRRELYLSFARPQDGGAGTALARALEAAPLLVSAVKTAGFAYAALDLEGYRTGAMDEAPKD
mgnify:CR=1 FL=1